MVHEEGVFVFAGVAEDAVLADDDVTPDIDAWPELGIGADVGGALDKAVGREFDARVNINGAFDG